MVDTTMDTEEIEAARAQQQRRKRYETWMNRVLGGGILFLFASMVVWIGFEVDAVLWAGTVLFIASYVGYVAMQYLGPFDVVDERDRQVEHEAGRLSIYIVGFVFVFLTPTAVAADATGQYEVPDIIWGVINAYVFLFIVIGITSWWVDRKHS